MTFPLLELPKWLQIEIFTRIAPNDFVNFAVSNKDIASLTLLKCTDEQKLVYGDQITESLYKDRSERFLADTLDHKDESVSWRQFYFRVIKFKKLSNKKGFNKIKGLFSGKLAERGKLLELKLISTFSLPTIETVNFAASEGHVHILQWGKDKYKLVPDTTGANWSAQQGKLNVLKWLKENKLSLPKTAIYTAGNGHLDILIWMKENGCPLPGTSGANMAAKNGHLNILQWMKENNLDLTDSGGADYAIEHGHLEILKWMKENNLQMPTQYGANMAAKYDCLDCLKWLYTNNLTLPDREGRYEAYLAGHDEIIAWIDLHVPKEKLKK